ncbi:MAG: hypothetical protein PHO29_12225 [Acetobacterium sp.]|nr:hypothetical protein [Acetobacterium sp.]
MKPEKLREIISPGEGLTVEFKQSRNKLNRDVFETATVVICFWGVMIRVGLLGSNPLPLKS